MHTPSILHISNHFGNSYVYRNPIYHQVVFATTILITVGRIVYILKWSEAGERIPTEIKHSIAKLFGTGALLFAFGFLIWNLDNIFCDFLIEKKLLIGWPSAFLLEGEYLGSDHGGTDTEMFQATRGGIYLPCVGLLFIGIRFSSDVLRA